MELYRTYVPKLINRTGNNAATAISRTFCLSCGTEGSIRPDVVLFGESVRIPAFVVSAAAGHQPHLISAGAAQDFGAVVIVGTAGDVYPSSVIAQHVAQRCACPVAVVDPAVTRLMKGSRCDLAVRGSAEEVLGEVAAAYLGD